MNASQKVITDMISVLLFLAITRVLINITQDFIFILILKCMQVCYFLADSSAENQCY